MLENFPKISKRYSTEEVVDLGEQALLPGLINAHCHLDYTCLRGKIPRQKSFTDWIRAINAEKAKLSPEDYVRIDQRRICGGETIWHDDDRESDCISRIDFPNRISDPDVVVRGIDRRARSEPCQPNCRSCDPKIEIGGALGPGAARAVYRVSKFVSAL